VLVQESERISYPVITLLTYAFLACSFLSCGAAPMKVIERLPSPDGMVDAVLVKRPTAAIAADVYELYIVPHKGNPDKRDLILRGDLFSGTRLAWEQSRLLELYYTQAYIIGFKNYWQSPDVDSLEYVVEIRLMPTGKTAIPPEQPD
jgi:hypothetical protein